MSDNKKRAREKYGYLLSIASLFFIAGIPLIIWGISRLNKEESAAENHHYEEIVEVVDNVVASAPASHEVTIVGNKDYDDYDKKETSVNNNYDSDYPNEEKVQTVLGGYCKANVDNDFAVLKGLFAPIVARYQGAKNETNEQIVNRHKRYDTRYNVYSKSSSIRWNTFRITDYSSDWVEAMLVEDYYIDREDKSKPSHYVLEKHFKLDKSYRIVSIYDNQLSADYDY